MKLCNLLIDGKRRLGLVTERGVIDVSAAGLSMSAVIAGADREELEALAAENMAPVVENPVYDNIVDEAGKLICVGLNYREHAAKAGLPISPVPSLFCKFPDALAGTYLATSLNAPILVTNEVKSNMEMVQKYIGENLKPGGTVYILGGTSAVSQEFVDGLPKGYKVERLTGDNRYYTNLSILREANLEQGTEILVATGQKFADALSASATGKPILMVRGDRKALFDYQVEYLETLGKNNKFVIIGGDAAISPEIANQLKQYGTVERIAGSNRYETSVLIANRFFENPESAVVATGKKFPDGLCGGSLAYTLKAPLILTYKSQEGFAADYMKENKIEDGYILGGTSAVSDASGYHVFDTDKIEIYQ